MSCPAMTNAAHALPHPHGEETPTGPRKARPDDKLRAVSNHEATLIAVPRMRCGMQCRSADPGPFQILNVEWSRISSAPLTRCAASGTKPSSFETHRCAMLLRVRGGTVGTHFKPPRLQAAMIFFAAWVRKPDRV